MKESKSGPAEDRDTSTVTTYEGSGTLTPTSNMDGGNVNAEMIQVRVVFLAGKITKLYLSNLCRWPDIANALQDRQGILSDQMRFIYLGRLHYTGGEDNDSTLPDYTLHEVSQPLLRLVMSD